MIASHLIFTLMQSSKGFSLYLNKFHIAGPKLATGEGKVLHEWMVETHKLLDALNRSTVLVVDGVSETLRGIRSKGRAVISRLTKRKK